MNPFLRTELLLGSDAMDTLRKCRVAVFGVGGVGGYVVEALARCGVGAIDIVDNDIVDITNLNRQVVALRSNVGQEKVDVCRRRILEINPDCRVTAHSMFYLPENADGIDLAAYDYVVDCIDTVSAKLELARRCHELGTPLLASLGTARKIDPSRLHISDITKTHTDPLAKVMRKKLRNCQRRCSKRTPPYPRAYSFPPPQDCWQRTTLYLLLLENFLRPRSKCATPPRPDDAASQARCT